jgi:adenine-specific DNA-methyltransferase
LAAFKFLETATVDTNILFLQNKPKAKIYESKPTLAVRFTKDFDLANQSINDFIIEKGYNLTSLNQNSWVVGERDIYNIKEFVEEQGVEMEKWDNKINRGVVTGYNEAFFIDENKKNEIIKIDPKSNEIIKPLLRGKDLYTWFPKYENLYLICTFPSLKIDIEKYKGIKEHLLSFGIERLEQDGIGRKKTGNKWFETADQINFWMEFEKPKIIYPNMTKFLPFIYDADSLFYSNDKSFIITGERLKYLTCFLNSKLFKYCFSDNFPELQGGTRELRKVFFDKIPIKKINDTEEKPFDLVLDYLVALKKENSQEPSDHFMAIYFEQIANALVYELYFKEEFEKAGLAVAKYVAELPSIYMDNREPIIMQLRRAYIKAHEQNSPLRIAVETMTSIPQINLINYSVSI